ncbi:MAG: bifunctional glutamate N-acetyltransferase/amino-acid acetyltransferase ArgJ [Thermodesulfobacteriota bacterium]
MAKKVGIKKTGAKKPVEPANSKLSCPGFKASGISAGIKSGAKKDLGLIVSDLPATVAGVFTKNKVKAAPVVIGQTLVRRKTSSGVIVNSGRANACTGAHGLEKARAMIGSVEAGLGLKAGSILSASTGSIGSPFPIDKIIRRVPALVDSLSSKGFADFAEAIMTTDAYPKSAKLKARVGGKNITILGIAKGAGMIKPDMATMLAFFMTDFNIGKRALKSALKSSVDKTFNKISVDNDTSTNDTVLIFANALAGGKECAEGSASYRAFTKLLTEVSMKLAHLIVKDGEGATKFIEVSVKGAKTQSDANKATEAIADSYLVKTALFGSDPGWGRILAVLGRAKIKIDQNKVDITLNGVKVAKNGIDNGKEREAAKKMRVKNIEIVCDLKLGKFSDTRWTSDLSDNYVKFNSGM